MRLSEVKVANQRAALEKLAQLVAKAIVYDPRVRAAALAVTNDCDSRNEDCEINAVFNAVKSGDSRVKGLERGVRYVADPRLADYFTSPGRILGLCEIGACGEDCDGHAGLVCAMLGTLGYVVGLRAYAPNDSDEFVHVYPVVGTPKRDPKEYFGLDTTVRASYVGWEPPPGRVLTAWIK